MSKFFGEKVFLENKVAIKLYDYAKELPIFDYHCHLSPKDIFEDKVFYNLSQLWLEGDHYKWRVMRAYGCDEELITGNASPKDKFFAFAKALPSFIGNPVYHWAHLELCKYFGISLPICSKNAEEIWNTTEKMMVSGDFSAKKLIEKSKVLGVVTTDDPIDDLSFHHRLSKENNPFKVFPCFRADRLLNAEKEEFLSYIQTLGKVAGVEIQSYAQLKEAVKLRLDYFQKAGATAMDVSFADFPKEGEEIDWIAKVIRGEKLSQKEIEGYKFSLLTFLGTELQKRNMVMQLHVGVIRNDNGKLFSKLGADCGGDSVANPVDIGGAVCLLDKINTETNLPKTIIYTLNPTAYYPLSTLLGAFQGGERGKLQLGAAWWFADHREGIKEQMRHLASQGGLGLFNGMLTDSRSFTSYARHDYFRKILCSLIGEWVENGEYPEDEETLEKLIKDICFDNAVNYFGVKL